MSGNARHRRRGRLVTLIIVSCTGLARAEGTGHESEEETYRAHMMGVRLDFGGKGDGYGLYYLYSVASGSASDGLGFLGWAGVGLDLRVVTYHGEAAIAVDALARAGGVGDAGGGSSEISVGVASAKSGLHAACGLGLFYSAYFVDLGYAYQVPCFGSDRPPWMSGSHFGVRLQAPVHQFGDHVARTSTF
jgi:hypothetical protein